MQVPRIGQVTPLTQLGNIWENVAKLGTTTVFTRKDDFLNFVLTGVFYSNFGFSLTFKVSSVLGHCGQLNLPHAHKCSFLLWIFNDPKVSNLRSHIVHNLTVFGVHKCSFFL